MGKYLSRDQILTTQEGIRTQEVPVPEWGGVVLVRELTAIQAAELGLFAVSDDGRISMDGDKLDRDSVSVTELVAMFPRVVAACVVDEDLNAVLSIDDVRAMGARSSAPIQRIAEIALNISGLSDTETDDESEDSPPKNG